MFIRLRLCVALLFGCLLPAQLVPAPQAEEQTLRKITESILCASNKDEAEYYLRLLQASTLFPPSLPDESADNNPPVLRASTVNTVLSVLYESSTKYPANNHLIQQAVTRWNFCSIIDNGKFFDHYVANGQTVRSPSAKNKNHNWKGFRAFGLLPGTTREGVFNYSSPYQNTAIRALADRSFQQTYINHCLPHPDDEHLYRDFGRNFISRVQPSIQHHSPLKAPEWSLDCKTEALPVTQAAKPPEQISITESNAEPATPTIIQHAKVNALHPIEIEENSNDEQAPVLTAANKLPALHSVPVKIVPQHSTPVSKSVSIPTSEVAPVLAAAIEPATNVTPVVVTSPRNGPDVVTPSSRTSKGLSGSISLNNSAFRAQNTSLSYAISYKPLPERYWFIRTGFNISHGSNPLTYSWGIGYDDWHPGTWAVQLNHWGPLTPGDGLNIDNAVAELSYKLNKAWLKQRNLSSSVSVSKPLSSGAALNWGWSWNPYPNWFLRSTLSKPIGESGLNWSYGFGYTRYTANSLSIEYNNWGPNEFPDLNFKKNALISLIYRWAF